MKYTVVYKDFMHTKKVGLQVWGMNMSASKSTKDPCALASLRSLPYKLVSLLDLCLYQ